MSDPSLTPARLTKLDFLLSILGAIAWGLSLIGVVTNLLLGSLVLLAALGVVTYEFLRWSKSKAWPAILRVITVVVVGVLVLWSGSRQVVYQFHQDRAGEVVTVASPQATVAATSSPSALPSPSLIQQSGSDETRKKKEGPDEDKESVNEATQQNVQVRLGQTGTAFAGDIRIGLNGMNFKVDPIRYTVNATINSPGYKSLSIRDRETNDPVIYTARAVYEIDVRSATDSFSATFQVTRLQEQAQASTASKRRNKSQGARHKAAIDALLGKH